MSVSEHQGRSGVQGDSGAPLGPDVDRDDIGRHFCVGKGIEFGAGTRPTAVHPLATVRYADKRSDDELKAYFAVGDVVHAESLDSMRGERFDFVIAHHVLEHCANAIEALVEWMALIGDDGVIYLSLPNRDTSPDALRLHTSPTHFLLDYICRIGEDDFESREHIAGFLWSWYDVGGLEGKNKQESAALVSRAAHADRNDLHWHTFTLETLKFAVRAAADVSGRRAELLFEQDGHTRRDEHRVVFRLLRQNGPQDGAVSPLIAWREKLRGAVDEYALSLLDGVVVRSLSANGPMTPMLVDAGELRPVRNQYALNRLGRAEQEPVYFEPVDRVLGEPVNIGPGSVRLSDAWIRRLHARTGARGARISIDRSVDRAPELHVDIFDDPSGPAVDVRVCRLPVVPTDADAMADLRHALGQGTLAFVILDDALTAMADPISVLDGALQALADEGTLLLRMRDRTASRSAYRRESHIGDVLWAHASRLSAPSRAMRFAHYGAIDPNASADASNSEGVGVPAFTPLQAMRRAADDTLRERIECYAFGPGAFASVLEALSSEGHLRFGRLAILEDTPMPGDFLVELAPNRG